MSSQLFQRRVKLTISTPVSTPGDFLNVTRDELVVTDLRVAFAIKKSDGKEPNTAEITITNLNADQRGKLQQKGVKVTLDAGYQDTGLSRIWRGDARTIDHVRNGPDWDSVIKCGDGERSYQNARVSESFAPGTGAGDVLRYLANASGLQIGNTPTVLLNIVKTFDQGYVVSGPWKAEIARFMKGLGYVLSIQNETIQVLLPGQSTNAEIPLVSPDSGLIGSPEFGTPEKKGKPALVKFKSLLIPSTPGALVHLKSQRYDGQVYVKKIAMDGDSFGGPWYTTFDGILQKPVSA